MIDTELIDGVRIVRMAEGENALNAELVTALATALDEAADPGGPLVLTGEGKFFCNGLDLGWLGSAAPAEAAQMFRDLHAILARVLRFPGPVVAAVNGHAFGAGAVIAAAADFRIQRADRGYLCFPEVETSSARGRPPCERSRSSSTRLRSRCSTPVPERLGGGRESRGKH